MGGGGGGKGGSQETTTKMELPKWMEPYAKDALAQGTRVAEMGYVPYMGPDLAAFAPQQMAGMQQSADLASAFGMAAPQNVAASLPKPQTYAGGVQGYSSFPMYEGAQSELAKKYPGLAEYLSKFTIDPQSGQMPTGGFGSQNPGGGGSGGGNDVQRRPLWYPGGINNSPNRRN